MIGVVVASPGDTNVSVMVETILTLSPWKVKPLWMTKLVADEVEIRFATETVHNESNHLVQSHASVDDVVGWPLA